jgi:hypothetical protein
MSGIMKTNMRPTTCTTLVSLWTHVLFISLFGSVDGDAPVRQTATGSLRGMYITESNALAEAYLGVPYAQPPIGRLRFEVCSLVCHACVHLRIRCPRGRGRVCGTRRNCRRGALNSGSPTIASRRARPVRTASISICSYQRIMHPQRWVCDGVYSSLVYICVVYTEAVTKTVSGAGLDPRWVVSSERCEHVSYTRHRTQSGVTRHRRNDSELSTRSVGLPVNTQVVLMHSNKLLFVRPVASWPATMDLKIKYSL